MGRHVHGRCSSSFRSLHLSFSSKSGSPRWIPLSRGRQIQRRFDRPPLAKSSSSPFQSNTYSTYFRIHIHCHHLGNLTIGLLHEPCAAVARGASQINKLSCKSLHLPLTIYPFSSAFLTKTKKGNVLNVSKNLSSEINVKLILPVQQNVWQWHFPTAYWHTERLPQFWHTHVKIHTTLSLKQRSFKILMAGKYCTWYLLWRRFPRVLLAISPRAQRRLCRDSCVGFVLLECYGGKRELAQVAEVAGGHTKAMGLEKRYQLATPSLAKFLRPRAIGLGFTR